MQLPIDRIDRIDRRQWLKLSGSSAAVGALGLAAAARASAASDVPTDAPTSPGADGVLDIVIIGAGFAGLTAARDLQWAGFDSFAVLEARNRVGGRALNHDLGGGHVSEVGGQWMGPGQTAVADLARELDVATFPTYYRGQTVMLGGNDRADGRLAIDLKGTFGTDLKVAERLSALSRDVPAGAPWRSPKAAELDRLSLGDWLAKQGIPVEERSGWAGSAILSGGAAPAKMGLLHFLSMISSANGDFEQLDSIKHSAQETRFVGGSQILCTKMARPLGRQLRLETPVRRISNWDGDVVTLHTDRGNLRARQVIMAINPALCQQIQFDPPLPAGRAALQRAWPAHSPARKTAMVYARPFWRDKGLNGHIFQVGGPVIWAFDNSPPGGEIGVINAFVMNAMLPAEHDAAQRALTAIYARALGSEALTPQAFHDRDWGRADPWSLTCVSAIPPGFWTRHGEALKPPCGRLIWSGTETAEIWAGYMDGAVRSGHVAALQALNALRRGARSQA